MIKIQGNPRHVFQEQMTQTICSSRDMFEGQIGHPVIKVNSPDGIINLHRWQLI